MAIDRDIAMRSAAICHTTQPGRAPYSSGTHLAIRFAAPMPNQIIYALVARGAVVLSEHYPDDVHDRSVDATSVVLKKLSAAPERSGEDKQSFLYDGQSFHVLTVDAISFVCAADNALSRISAFQFLRELQKFWQQIYRDLGQTARAYQMNADFARVIQQQIETFQMRFDAQTPDRIAQVNEEVRRIPCACFSACSVSAPPPTALLSLPPHAPAQL